MLMRIIRNYRLEDHLGKGAHHGFDNLRELGLDQASTDKKDRIMPKGYVIAHVSVTNPEAYQEYVARDTPIIASYGGRPLARGGRSEEPEGPQFDRHVIFEFDDFEQAKAMYNDPAYQEVAQIRRDNSDSMIVLVEGV